MNFVILTRAFYPHEDPESYCSTRFASALAKLGHSVHVVALDYPESKDGYRVLLHPNVKVTRVCVQKQPMKYPYINWRYLMCLDDETTEIPAALTTLKQVLRQYDHPILITRSVPISSVIIGWHCRKLASKWIAHFSDPIINMTPCCRLAVLKLWLIKFWMRRAMKKADAISVTCKRVRWYYRAQLGPCVDRARFILTTHIGDFKLDAASGRNTKTGTRAGGLARPNGVRPFPLTSRVDAPATIQSDSSSAARAERPDAIRPSGSGACPRHETLRDTKEHENVVGKKDETTTTTHYSLLTSHCIYHDGDIYGGRGLLMVDAVDKLNAEGFKCTFFQGRDVRGEADRKRILASPNCRIVGKDAAPELKELAKSASVSFVADFNTPGLDYSPFLMSKFVYQLFTEKPIVVLSKLESEKHDYCVAYPEAGLFFAEIGNVDSLVAAIKAAFACDPSKLDRTRIREAFSEETIGRKFVEAVEKL